MPLSEKKTGKGGPAAPRLYASTDACRPSTHGGHLEDSGRDEMYGLVNQALEDFVRQGFGDAAWNTIRDGAGVSQDMFVSMDSYPNTLHLKTILAYPATFHGRRTGDGTHAC